MPQGKLLGVLFFEASTRTSCSFQAAMLRLGGGVVPLNVEVSSAKKGENLEGIYAILHGCISTACTILLLLDGFSLTIW